MNDNIVSSLSYSITGAWAEFFSATYIAESMVKRYGMSDKIGLRYTDGKESNISEEVKCSLDAEVTRLLNESYSRVTEMLTRHKTELDVIASALQIKKTLYGDEIKNLIDDHLSKIVSGSNRGVVQTDNLSLEENNNIEQSFSLLGVNKT